LAERLKTDRTSLFANNKAMKQFHDVNNVAEELIMSLSSLPPTAKLGG
jgi:hypothetical protein